MNRMTVAGLRGVDSDACSSGAPASKVMRSNSVIQGGRAEGHQVAVVNEFIIGRLLMLNKAGYIEFELNHIRMAAEN
jgi:hypothetical protein